MQALPVMCPRCGVQTTVDIRTIANVDVFACACGFSKPYGGELVALRDELPDIIALNSRAALVGQNSPGSQTHREALARADAARLAWMARLAAWMSNWVQIPS